jgi:glycosyltransferase involved in cell wall biosynthesis
MQDWDGNMKKICFLKNDYNGGGTERVTSIIANSLANYNKEFEVYVLDIGNPEMIQSYKLDKRVRHYSLSGKKMGKIGVFINNYKVYRFLKENNIDVLINVQAMMGINSIIPTLFTKTKNVIWEHANYFQKQGTRVINIVRQIELFLSSQYIVLTHRDMNNFKNNFICRCPINYLYNPIIETTNNHNYSSDSKVIMSAGHLRHIKGFDILIEVASNVFKRHTDWVWKIYGEGAERSNLEKKIKEMGLESNVILCGRTSNIEEDYKEAAMFVMTSRMEGLPMVLLEAKSFNLPIVSFDIETGPNEIIEHNKNGFLVEKYDTKLMAEKICELIETPNIRKNFSNNAKSNIHLFNIDNITKEWTKLLNEIMNRH